MAALCAILFVVLVIIGILAFVVSVLSWFGDACRRYQQAQEVRFLTAEYVVQPIDEEDAAPSAPPYTPEVGARLATDLQRLGYGAYCTGGRAAPSAPPEPPAREVHKIPIFLTAQQ